MAKKRRFPKGSPVAGLFSDRDWITTITALLRDPRPESKALAKRLLAVTKHGRQVRLLQLISRRRPRIWQMMRSLRVSRRTIFRDLNTLEDYGVRLTVAEGVRYEAARLPKSLEPLLRVRKRTVGRRSRPGRRRASVRR